LPQPAPIDAAALLESFNRLDITALDGIDDDAPADDVSHQHIVNDLSLIFSIFFFFFIALVGAEKCELGFEARLVEATKRFRAPDAKGHH
jgi:hypothetical protein